MAEKKKVPEIRFKGFDAEWEERKLGEIAEFNPKSELPEIFEYVDLESVVGTEMVAHRKERRDTAPSRAQRLADHGDLFYQTVRPYQKNNYLFEKNCKNYVFSTGYAQMRPSGDGYFLLSLIQNDEFVKTVLDNCTGTSYPAINSNNLAELAVYTPTTDEEQSQIGKLFTHLDQLITLHQQKYNKLQSIKKAMLQKMFPQKGAAVPEIRFKGFTEDWEEKRLGRIGDTYTGLSGKSKEDFGHGEGKFVTYMNVFSNPIAKPNLTEPIEVDYKQREVKAGDVFFTTSSETPEEVGMSSVWLDNFDNVYLNSFCFGYRPVEKINSFYLAYMLRSSAVRKKIAFLAQGISRYNISKNRVMEIAVPIPNIIEQEKVGTFFSNLDNLITLHQQELEKLKNIKKAMLEKMFV